MHDLITYGFEPCIYFMIGVADNKQPILFYDFGSGSIA